jgi:hypothetical protein
MLRSSRRYNEKVPSLVALLIVFQQTLLKRHPHCGCSPRASGRSLGLYARTGRLNMTGSPNECHGVPPDRRRGSLGWSNILSSEALPRSFARTDILTA